MFASITDGFNLKSKQSDFFLFSYASWKMAFKSSGRFSYYILRRIESVVLSKMILTYAKRREMEFLKSKNFDMCAMECFLLVSTLCIASSS